MIIEAVSGTVYMLEDIGYVSGAVGVDTDIDDYKEIMIDRFLTAFSGVLNHVQVIKSDTSHQKTAEYIPKIRDTVSSLTEWENIRKQVSPHEIDVSNPDIFNSLVDITG